MYLLIGVLILAGSLIPIGLRALRRERENRLLAMQLRQALQGMVHSLRVGGGFLQALARVADDAEPPLAPELKAVMHSVRMGNPLNQALTELKYRVPLRDVAWFVTAAQITQETGGSLAGVLETLAETLQERETLREKVAALTAQGKASGLLLSVLPFVLMGVLAVIAPEMVKPLFFTSTGQMLLAGVLVGVSVGGVVIYQIVSIRVD